MGYLELVTAEYFMNVRREGKEPEQTVFGWKFFKSIKALKINFELLFVYRQWALFF